MNVNLDLSIFYVLFCFFVVFFVARNTLWKRLDEILGQRHELIEGNREKAAGNDQLIEEKLSSINARLAEAREKAMTERAKSREQALQEQEKVVTQARSEGQTLLESSQKDLEESLQQARETLASESDSYARSIADSIMRRTA
jgi:F0F1-type ATP synthase membrane subunit b/b'